MKPGTPEYREAFIQGYKTCALWSSTDTIDGKDVDLNTFNIEDIHPDTIKAMEQDCDRFIAANAGDLDGIEPSQAGHDFWLTRCEHGAGFWDRGLEERGDRLTAACGWRTAFPNVDLYVGDDGMIYH